MFAAVAVSGLKLNAWIRRACMEQADLERAVAAQDEPRVASRTALPDRVFRPDFGKRLKP